MQFFIKHYNNADAEMILKHYLQKAEKKLKSYKFKYKFLPTANHRLRKEKYAAIVDTAEHFLKEL